VGLKPVAYTRHAERELGRRQISRAWVERTARQPLWVEPDPDEPDVQRRFAVVPEFGGRVLRVAVRETTTRLIVVTAVFDRGARRRLLRGERP
jgi:Domain of unknown function (DUF4258)